MGALRNGILFALCGLCLIHMAAALSDAEPMSESLQRRSAGTCRSIVSVAGDTCYALAKKCDVSLGNFRSLNQDVSCEALPIGKPMCCSTGDHLTPLVTRATGATCNTYTIFNGESCASIAKVHGVTEANIELWNKNTFAWFGCNKLQDGGQMCISAGEPPMPVAIGDAVCGPQVPGTARPLLWTSIASLNPCPAGQCCSPRGQCGTGANFCGSSGAAGASTTKKAAPANKPATTKPATTRKSAPTKKSISSTQTTLPLVTITSVQWVTTKATTGKYRTGIRKPRTTSTTTKATTGKYRTGIRKPRTKSTSTTSTSKTFYDMGPMTYLHTESTEGAQATGSQTTTSAASKGTVVTAEKGWSIEFYHRGGCESTYYEITGNNKYLKDAECLKFSGSNAFTEDNNQTATSCRFANADGTTARLCDSWNIYTPKTLRVKNGLCEVSESDNCDNYNAISTTYGARQKDPPCLKRGSGPSRFGSMKCYVG